MSHDLPSIHTISDPQLSAVRQTVTILEGVSERRKET